MYPANQFLMHKGGEGQKSENVADVINGSNTKMDGGLIRSNRVSGRGNWSSPLRGKKCPPRKEEGREREKMRR